MMLGDEIVDVEVKENQEKEEQRTGNAMVVAPD